MQKQGKHLFAVYNKPEPPKNKNILSPRKVKAERSDTAQADCNSLHGHAVWHFLSFNTQAPEFIKF